jgi:lysophospholipase L1-like esterase
MKLQLTEYQVKRILELLSEEENEKINVMFVGDSLSAAPGFTWNYLLAKDHPDWNVTHVVKGGMKTDWMLKNMLPKLKEKKYDKVFIYGGTNDAFWINVPLSSAVSNVQKMVDAVKNQGGTAYVFLGYDAKSVMTDEALKPTKYCDKPCMKKGRDRTAQLQQDLDSQITGAVIIPTIQGNSKWTADGTHPGPAQHQLMKSHVSKHINNEPNKSSGNSEKDSEDKEKDSETEKTNDIPDSDSFLKGLWKTMFGIKGSEDVKTKDGDESESDTDSGTEETIEVTPGERIVIKNPGISVRKYPSDMEQKMKKVVGTDTFNQFVKDVNSIGLDPIVAMRQLYSESAFSPDVVKCSRKSSAGAQGIAQFMPGTWPSYGTGSPCDPKQALKAYVKFMKQLMKMFPNRLDLAIAGYNSGPYKSAYKQALKNNTPFTSLKGKIPSESYSYASTILQP